MSSYATVTTMVIDVMEFVRALQDLKRAQRQASTMKTSDGQSHAVEVVSRDGLGRDAGLEKTEKGYQVITDCHELTPEQKKDQVASVNQVIQRYAYRKVIKELQSQGYTVSEEEKGADNTIRVTANKWVESMAYKQEIHIVILSNGEVRLEVKGLAGPACVPEIRKVAEKLGVVMEEEKTSEFL